MFPANTQNQNFRILSHRLTTLLYILLGLVVFLLLTISIPGYIFRQIVIVLAKYFRKDLDQILNGQSSYFVNELFSNRPLRSNTVVSITSTGKLTRYELEELILKNWILAEDKNTGLLKYPKFQQYPVRWLGFTFYRKAFATFDLDNHLHINSSLDENAEITENNLNQFTEKLLNSGYKPFVSPWEFHVIHNYKNSTLYPNNEELSVLIFKTHHSFADGFSILAALVEGILECPLKNVKIPIPFIPHKTTFQKCKDFLAFPYNVIYDIGRVATLSFRKSPWKISDSKKEWHQYCAKSDPIPIEKVANIKNALGVTFTSVLVSAISAGIYRHLEHRKQKDGNTIWNNESMFCISALPVPSHSMQLTNDITAAFFHIPTVNYPSSLKRLYDCYAKLETTRTSVMPYVSRILAIGIGSQIYPLGAPFVKNKYVSLALTNFPSLPVQWEKNGKVGLGIDFVVGGLEGDSGAMFSVLSYNKTLRICVTTEKSVMSKEDLNNLLDYISAEIDDLYTIVKNGQEGQ